MEHRFEVQDMTCGHCVARISRAIQAVDADAKLAIDLASNAVIVDGGDSRSPYEAAIRDAGYTPELQRT